MGNLTFAVKKNKLNELTRQISLWNFLRSQHTFLFTWVIFYTQSGSIILLERYFIETRWKIWSGLNILPRGTVIMSPWIICPSPRTKGRYTDSSVLTVRENLPPWTWWPDICHRHRGLSRSTDLISLQSLSRRRAGSAICLNLNYQIGRASCRERV